MKTSYYLIAPLVALAVSSCKDPNAGCPADADVLTSFVLETGESAIITESGEAYSQDDNGCTFLVQYFTPGWEDAYLQTDSGIYVYTDAGELYPVTNTLYDDVEAYDVFTDMMLTSITDTAKYWNSFTLQSPLAPTVEAYVALRACIMNNTCTFMDNRFDLVADPLNSTNQVLQCTAVPPSADMVTSKASIERSFNYFTEGDDLWYEARYYIASGMPYSLADFENRFFDQSPGPRIVIEGNKLAIENKFEEKLTYYPDAAPDIPVGEWFTVKVHFRFSTSETGLIELWQDNVLLMSVNGKNLPNGNSIQTSLEVGATATSDGCVLLIDDIKLSPIPF